MSIDLEKVISQSGVEVAGFFDLSLYDHRMDSLYRDLSEFKNFTFRPNQRLVFLHVDIEYIVDTVRFTLYNLQKILHNLSIPNYFCMIVGQQSTNQDLIFLRDLLTNDPHPISQISFEGYLCSTDHSSSKVELNENLIEKQFIFLSNQPRRHRNFLASWLQHNNLISKGLISYSNENKDNSFNEYQENNKQEASIGLLTTFPWTRINEHWNVSDHDLLEIFSNQIPSFKNFVEPDSTNYNQINALPLQRAFCYISNETMFNSQSRFTSEKSFKPFYSMRPMISFGSPGVLQKLRDYGFKTWNQYWSEDYDDISDHARRFQEVAGLIQQISEIPTERCRSMLLDMEPMLRHNRDLYVDSFVGDQIKSVREQILTNLSR